MSKSVAIFADSAYLAAQIMGAIVILAGIRFSKTKEDQ
jgi:divalent metal cation (Fe/Co/Zn/Cd) transporter